MSEEKYNEKLGAAIENAAGYLPEGYVLRINIERYGWGLELHFEGDEPRLFDNDSLIDDINEAVSHAVDMSQP